MIGPPAMITLDTLNHWLAAPAESEHLEFKEAKQQYDTTKLMRYCVALANEGGGHLVLGVSDKKPRRIVGSQAFASPDHLNNLKARIVEKLRIHVECTELPTPEGRVLVLQVLGRPLGQALDYEGAYLMRAGEDLVPMTQDRLRSIFAEGQPTWLQESAARALSADNVVALLDTQGFFDLLNQPYPTTRDGVLAKLSAERLIAHVADGWCITRLAALLLAKRLDAFPFDVARKAARVVIYDGVNKLQTREDTIGQRGYAVGFAGLVDFVHSAAPQNRFIEQAVREEVKMFPKQALRELIANALVHQDFSATGASVMIEMYADRLEVSNPGLPPISVDRFIDEYGSRNERMADLMRRLGISEEKGSGVDKVVAAAELHQLPAPDFRVSALRTTAVLFAHQEFADMSKRDRVRACYQHCCLQYVGNQRMSNQSLRERFRMDATKTVAVSQLISAARGAGLIKADESESGSTRYARYLPFWA